MVPVWPISLPTFDQDLLMMIPNTTSVPLYQALSVTSRLFMPLACFELGTFFYFQAEFVSLDESSAEDTKKQSEIVGKSENKHTAVCVTIQRPVKGLTTVRVVPRPIFRTSLYLIAILCVLYPVLESFKILCMRANRVKHLRRG